MRRITLILLLTIMSNSCTTSEKDQETKSISTMYFNGDIIAMEGDSPTYAEALVVKNGKIFFIGSKEEAVKLSKNKVKKIDLKGKTLLPSFIYQ